jgi:enolase-phosphatase E1
VTAAGTGAPAVVLLDIEGTTTPLAFVHDVLFPYARAHVAAWVAARPPHDQLLAEIAAAVRDDAIAAGLASAASSRPDVSRPEERDLLVQRVAALMDQDRKSPGLKRLQGLLWEQGYADGSLVGQVYPDVRPALVRWTTSGRQVGIFSSGSVLAQKLLFARSTAGDLTPFLRWHFDTAVGAKGDQASYRRIAQEIGASPAKILFISDVSRELDAARAAGFMTRLCARGDRPPASHPLITSFDQVS